MCPLSSSVLLSLFQYCDMEVDGIWMIVWCGGGVQVWIWITHRPLTSPAVYFNTPAQESMENETGSRPEGVLLYGDAQTHTHSHTCTHTHTTLNQMCRAVIKAHMNVAHVPAKTLSLSHTHTHLYVNHTCRRVLTMSTCPHILCQWK